MLNYKNKKVLVTGGCGFIGRNVANELVKLGAQVTVFDVNLTKLRSDILVIKGDIKNIESLDVMTRGKDYVFHLAASLGVEATGDIPLQVLETNLFGTVNVLRASLKNGVGRVLFSSSSEVYGEPQMLPISEGHPKAPVSTYGVAKLASEHYCDAFYKEYGLECTVVRLFNVYGPDQNKNFVMPRFISQALNGLPITIYGDGTQSRSYTFITDAVDGILRAASSEKALGEVLNIGNDKKTSLKELANIVLRAVNSDVEPIYKNFGDGIREKQREILQRQPDISKAASLIDFKPKVLIKEGVNRFIKEFNHV
jgi:UDP-glucose 4-epimerase